MNGILGLGTRDWALNAGARRAPSSPNNVLTSQPMPCMCVLDATYQIFIHGQSQDRINERVLSITVSPTITAGSRVPEEDLSVTQVISWGGEFDSLP